MVTLHSPQNTFPTKQATPNSDSNIAFEIMIYQIKYITCKIKLYVN
jgi:hypothetical protein